MIHLDLDDLLHIARWTLGDVEVRDIGLLDSAAARPRSTAFGEDVGALAQRLGTRTTTRS